MNQEPELKPCNHCGSVEVADMQRCLLWMQHENLCAEREEKMGYWLTDHSEAIRLWDAEYMKAKEAWNTRHESAEIAELKRELKASREFVKNVREFTNVCACNCGEKMADTDLDLYLRWFDAAMLKKGE